MIKSRVVPSCIYAPFAFATYMLVAVGILTCTVVCVTLYNSKTRKGGCWPSVCMYVMTTLRTGRPGETRFDSWP